VIKNIFLHIGIHKTATTTIQNTLYIERAKLMEAGVLYPVFKAGNISISNHSIPFYSLFNKLPKKYHFNVSHGFTTDEAIQQIHDEYRQQLNSQILGFAGETLVISGEDISLLETDEIQNLKAYLKELTHPDVHFKVVMMCRHPVSRFRSALQGSVCAFGMTIEKAVERHLGRTQLYCDLFHAFSEVFGRTQLCLMKYEDAIAHPFGPAAAFLALIDKDLPDKIKPVRLHDNPTRKYETFVLLNAVNQTCYHTSADELQPERMVELNKLFREMPGQKFMLPQGLSKKVWETLAGDVNWLCQEFSLPEYPCMDEDMKPDADLWSKQTLEYLGKTLPHIPIKYRKAILLELLRLIIKRSTILSTSKRGRMLLFVAAHSKTLL
jgi:hypothetical protein